MTNEKNMLFIRIYNIVFSIVLGIAGLCLIAGCITIYNMGDKPFSREIVAETFKGIAIPVYICLAMLVISIALEIILPTVEKKEKPRVDYKGILGRLYQKRNLNTASEELRNSILKLQKNRKFFCIMRLIVLVISGVAFLIYALNGSNFHSGDINSSMVRAMWVLIPCLAASFGFAIFTTYHNTSKFKEEIELAKQLPAADGITDEKKCCCTTLQIAKIAIVVASICFIVLGFLDGATTSVITKAINICTECIGLG